MVARVSSGRAATPGAVALDERPDHAVVAQELGDGEDDIGRRGAGPELAGDAQAHHRGQEHGEGLAQHGRLGLDAADAPAQHAQAVDHGRVRVGPDQRVAEGPAVRGGEHQPGQVLEVDLVADARPGGHGPEAVEGALGPAEQLVALDVALVLNGDVLVIGRGVARALDDDGVVDDQLHRDQRVDLRRVAPEARQGVAHGGQVDHAGHPGEVLHEDALGGQGDLVRRVARALPVGLGVGAPGGHGHDVVGRDVRRVLVAQQVLQNHLDRIGQPAHLVARRPGTEP